MAVRPRSAASSCLPGASFWVAELQGNRDSVELASLPDNLSQVSSQGHFLFQGFHFELRNVVIGQVNPHIPGRNLWLLGLLHWNRVPPYIEYSVDRSIIVVEVALISIHLPENSPDRPQWRPHYE